jgi:hypothetical protein
LASSIGRHPWSPLAGIIGQEPRQHVPNTSMMTMLMMIMRMLMMAMVMVMMN